MEIASTNSSRIKWKDQNEGLPNSHDEIDSDSKEPNDGVEKLSVKRTRKQKEEHGCGWKRSRYENEAGTSSKQNDREKNKEGRHCELCGGGSDGKAPISMKGKHENDGFGDEDGWLGHLLGPINDRHGIPRIWIHYQCAVWSPEVHFVGSGCLKNVKTALNRGKSLKCSHCRRHGATLGCRIDECPKTYHLACARSNGCKFDHKEFLMACTDHRHIFQPNNDQYSEQKKLRAKKRKLEIRKPSNDAHQKDILLVEEKWIDDNHNESEDEEFFKGEGKKRDGDFAKIVPTFIGGHTEDGEKEKLVMAGWESVAGLQHVIECMKELVVLPLLYPEFFEGLGITPPRGVLLHGYPGTGKTHVVRALVGSCARGDKRIAYFARKGADCLGKYVGDSEQQLKHLFQVAEECQPSIIFFDEIDGLAPCRTSQQDQTHTSVVSTLLALLDGLKSRGCVVVIGATNRPNAIDPALRRPGRFDREIYFPLPSLEDRISILSLYTQKWPKTLESNAPLLQWIARKTSGFAGADLQALCTQTAIIALKRTFPLKQVLHASNHHHPTPHLPVVIVEERDWLEALSTSPPPCSRREASVAANDVASSPLPSYLIPCLIQPLSILLVSLYLEEGICLPHTLFKAATIIKTVMVSALERKKMVSNKWWFHVDDLIQEDDIANEIERKWQGSGANILEESSFADSHNYIPEDISTINHANANQTSFDLGNSPGFRIMIAGNPRSGQRHLASCILNCFVEHVEIRKVDITTISAGYNKLGQGISYTLGNCLSRGPCLIFMPRVDLWAIESHDGQTLEHDTQPSDEQCITKATIQRASYAWTIFIDQVESFSLSTPFIFLATSEVPFLLLPQEIRHFFRKDLSNCKLVAFEHNIPRFSVQIDGTFNHDLVINQSAAKLSKDMVKLLVLLIHQKNHVNNTSVCNKNRRCDLIEEQACTSNNQKDKESISEDLGATRSFEKPCTKFSQPNGINNTTSAEKTNLLSEISTFGYQILQNPQFSELCWVTSKFKEGPSANISKSHWKDWQFNSCVLHPTSSSDNVQTKENYGMVKGLVAVGLLATRGVYTSLQEVCYDVRTVLGVLVEKVNAKVNAGKDRLQYTCILSQVASLEDTVYSWAYALQSSKQDSLKTGIPRHSTSNNNQIQGKKSTDENVEHAHANSPNLSLSSTKIDPSSLQTSMCSINCCSDCLNILHIVTKMILMHEFRSMRFDRSTDNIHDIVMSMSVNLLTTVRKSFVDGMGNHSFDEKQREENYDRLLESYDFSSCGCKVSRNMIVMPLECSCHSPSRTSSSEGNASHLTQLKLNSKFVFSNNILVDVEPRKDVSFHCEFETLCLSSLIQLIVMIKKPFN